MSNDLLKDLERFSGAINRHKSDPSTSRPTTQQSNIYINPRFRAPTQVAYQSRAVNSYKSKPPSKTVAPPKKDVLIGGVTFTSSKNTLTRKDAPTIAKPAYTKPPSRTTLAPSWHKQQQHSGPTYPAHRSYKPKRARNRVLNNVDKSGRLTAKAAARARKTEKQCSFFSQTGICGRGMKCLYKHDPLKVAICPGFLRGDCPHSAENCLLSHDPTPERVPLCVHFANQGRCKNGDNCLYPHVHISPRSGVCRDFAVLGYCDKGIDCDKQHLKECPSFAESGVCNLKNCKLPHVIRANARRATATAPPKAKSETKDSEPKRFGISFSTMAPEVSVATDPQVEAESSTPANVAVTEAEVDSGDYIPLTFEESEGDDEDDEEDAEEEDSEDESDASDNN